MRRKLLPVLTVVMVLSLATSAWAGAVLRVNHALASAGMVELVICGAEGAETVTLDRDGNRIDPAGPGACGHCADCLLSPAINLPDAAGLDIPSTLSPDRIRINVAQGAAQTVARTRARDPPAETES